MKIVTVNIPESYLDSLERLVGENGIFPSRSEAVRVAVRDFLIRELKMANSIPKCKEEVEDFDDKNFVRVPVDRLNQNDEYVREFKTYKIIKKLEGINSSSCQNINTGKFIRIEMYNESFDDVSLPNNYSPPSLEELRKIYPHSPSFKYINE